MRESRRKGISILYEKFSHPHPHIKLPAKINVIEKSIIIITYKIRAPCPKRDTTHKNHPTSTRSLKR